jgi:PAS domain S-box-containing protein
MKQNESFFPWAQGLFQIAQALSREAPEEVRPRLLDYIVRGFDADSGSLALLTDDGVWQRVVAATGAAANYIGARRAAEDGVFGYVIRSSEPLVLQGAVGNDPRFRNLAPRDDSDRPQSTLCWPLLVDGVVIGALSLNRGRGRPPFTQDDVRDGGAAVNLMALVLDNVQLQEQLGARIDHLHKLNMTIQQRRSEFEREHAERVAHEQWLSAIVDLAPGAIIITDTNLRILRFNRGAEVMFGRNATDVFGRPIDLLLPERFRRTHAGYVEEFARCHESMRAMDQRREVLGVRADGTEFPAGASVSRIEVGGARYYIAILHDLTVAKKTERELARALRDRANIMNTIQDLLYEVDIDARLVHWNQHAEHATGYGADELRLKPALEFFAPERHATVLSSIHQALTDGRAEVELPLLRKDGTEVPYHWVSVALRDEQGRVIGITGIGRDVTDLKRNEENLRRDKQELQALNQQLRDAQHQLLQSEKMASIGQLAAGVAHEINNPVGYINSNIGSLKQYLDALLDVIAEYEKVEDSLDPATRQRLKAKKYALDLDYLKQDARDLVRECAEGVQRVRQIVQDLKDFSRVGDDVWLFSDLHKGLDSTLNIAHNELKYKCEVAREYADLPEIECVPSQLNQVFMNLLVNAGQAIETHGTIVIRTGRGDGDWVWVEIEDSGKGIAPEHVRRIFDPFFTTKPVGKGTGLGLSISYGIVKKHNGRIEVDSAPGRGTRFRVWLPMRRAADASQAVA